MDFEVIFQLGFVFASLITIAASLKISRDGISSAQRIAEVSSKLLHEQILSQRDIAISQIEASKAQAKDEVLVQVLSKNRQEWINELRNTIAEFITSIQKLKSIPSGDPEVIHSITGDTWFHLSKIKLLINPKEVDHMKLIAEANNLLDSIINPDLRKLEREMEEKLIETGQSILKREWERVKSLT